MSTVPAKQIIKVLSAPIRVSGFAAAGPDDVVTSVITTALSSAGNAGVSVPLQVSSAVTAVGIITSPPGNRTEIYNATSKDKIAHSSGNEVYGRITESGGVYTLTYYYYSDAGVETPYSFASTSIDFEFNYRFDFDRLPAEAIVAIKTRNIADDPTVSSGGVYTEKLVVTAQNTISDLAKTPTTSGNVLLFINGIVYDTFSTAPFSISGKAITWSASNAGFSVETTDRVVAHYTTNE
ncbi:MAG: hypothetical protein WCA35_14355 [Kovacikia sp.]